MSSLIRYSLYLICILIAFTDTLAAKVDPSRLTYIPEKLTSPTIALMRRCKTAAIVNLMDRDVEPCNNFYKFACGKWTNVNPANTIEHQSTGRFEALSQLFDRKVEKLLTNDAEFNYTAIDRKVQDFFVSCVNLVKLKDKYKQKLRDIIAEFGEMPALSGGKWNAEKFDWVTTIAKIAHKYDKDIIIGIEIMADVKDNSINRVYISQAELPLESRAMYLDDSTAVYRDSYKRKIRKELIKFLGLDAQLATETANEIVDFEVKLAQGMIDESLGQTVADLSKQTTVELMQAKYGPVIDIKKLVNITLGELITAPVYEYAEVYQRNLKKIIPETPKEVLANYIFYTLISDHMLDTDTSLRESEENLLRKTKSYFAKNLDNMVYRRYSTGKTETDVEYMWKELKENFKSTLTSGKLDWIAEPTRQYALQKLDALRMEINSYADHNFTEEFGSLVTNNNDYLANVLAIMELNTKRSFAKLHEKPKPVEVGEGVMLSYTPANILSQNVIKLPVSILQPYLLWSEVYPIAVKFGTLGALVGHELIHAFDDKGRRYDKDGNSRDWWDEESTEIFLNRTECFSNQYSKYQYGGRFLPKSVSQSENIADNGGMRLAYQAYLRWYEDAKRAHNEKMSEKLPDFPYDFKQLFFISFAQIWCNDVDPDLKNQQTSTDQHMPGEFRVIGTLSNSKEFAAAFGCAEDAPMNPKHKCEIY